MYDAPCDISDELKRQIADDRANHRLNPFRCLDEDVVRRFDASRDASSVWRPAYVRDIEKIINTPAYNRYTGKTQVFSFMRNDDVSRRGLHVQLVARAARNIGAALGLNCDLIEAIALGHDIGHTPFGHTGERALDAVHHRHSGQYFRHNVQSVRLLDTMYSRNVSLQTLDGALCHNGEYEQRVFRTSGICSFDELDRAVETSLEQGDSFIKTLAPMTLEGCVVRISDIIAYVGKDRQDAVSCGMLDHNAPFATGACGSYNAWVLSALTVDIVENSYGKDHIEMSERAFAELAAAKRENYERIYRSPEVEGMCDATITPMFERLYERCLDDLRAGDESSPIFREHVEPLLRQTSYYGRTYPWEENLFQTVADYLASMTDDCFLALNRHFFGDEPPIPMRDYFDGYPNAPQTMC